MNSTLGSTTEWKYIVTSTDPTVEFHPSPVPFHLTNHNNSLANALQSRIDQQAKDLLPPSIVGGVEILHYLQSFLSPTITSSTESSLRNQVSNPKRPYHETPMEYYLRIIESQRKLNRQGIKLDVSTNSFARGLLVPHQKDKNSKIFF